MPIAQDTCAKDINTLVRMVEADFREMPGMRLTRAQAQRLWNMSPQDCADVLGYLLSAGRLVCDPAGQYCVSRGSY